MFVREGILAEFAASDNLGAKIIRLAKLIRAMPHGILRANAPPPHFRAA